MTNVKENPKRPGTARARKTGVSVNLSASSSKPRGKVTFGNVTIAGVRPSAEIVRENVERSTTALQRVTRKLTTPGVTLSKKKGVPRFSVDEDDPSIFIRVLNGKTDRGRIVNGEFEIIE